MGAGFAVQITKMYSSSPDCPTGVSTESKWHSLRSCHFIAQKSLDFQDPLLPMPRVMMLHPSKPLSTSAIKTTGTLVVYVPECCCVVLLCVVVCKRGGEVSLQIRCVRRYSGGGGWLAGLPLPVPIGDGRREVLVHNVIHYVPVLHPPMVRSQL